MVSRHAHRHRRAGHHPRELSERLHGLHQRQHAHAPLYLSLFTLDNTTGENYYLNTDTAPKSNIPTGIPLYYQNTAPGQTDSFQESIRFGPAGTDPYTLAPDVIQNYANAYPMELNWPDRRPIASLHLSGPTSPDYATNPEGWFNDSSSVNVTTQAGLDSFGSELLQYAIDSLPYLQSENAQGMIVWDIEGQEWAQPTTYIGDASLAFNTTIQNAVNVTYANGTNAVVTPMGYDYTGQYSLRDANGNPEPLINQFFQIFSNAGYRVGVTIRPTQITFSNGVPVQSTANEVTELEQKFPTPTPPSAAHFSISIPTPATTATNSPKSKPCSPTS